MSISKLDVSEKFHETVKDFVSRKIVAACLVSSAVLVHRLKMGEVIEGYLINDKMKYYVRHYWYRINEQDYDVGAVINMILMPDLFRKLGKRRRSQTAPAGYKYVSSTNENELEKLEEGFQLYSKNPKVFWKKSPGWIRQIVESDEN